ncbi:MAG: hypothetical protein ACKPHU_22545, partial [Planctomycetaceae bacterium]
MRRLNVLLLAFLIHIPTAFADEPAKPSTDPKTAEKSAGKRTEVRQRHTWAEIQISGTLPENTQPPGLLGAPADSLPTI